LVALLLPATRRAREPARRTQCRNNLKQIGLALHNYHDDFGVFPPAYTVDTGGRPLHSWRTLLLPYLDQKPLYDTIYLSKPWDDPANATACQTQLDVFHCPSFSGPAGQTTYLAVVTPDSCLQPGQSRTISQIKDGTSNTLIVIEAAQKDAAPWMSPQDADEALILSYGPEAAKLHAGGEHALLADGSVRFLSEKTAPETLRALITTTAKDDPGEF
jgi:hypothetical protein